MCVKRKKESGGGKGAEITYQKEKTKQHSRREVDFDCIFTGKERRGTDRQEGRTEQEKRGKKPEKKEPTKRPQREKEEHLERREAMWVHLQRGDRHR